MSQSRAFAPTVAVLLPCLAGGTAPALAAPKPLARMTVTNPLDVARPDEVIDLPLSEVLARASGAKPETLAVRDAAGGAPLVTQLIDEDNTGAPDHLLILADLAPKQTRRLEFFTAAAPSPAAPRVYGRFAPERKDDFAWESDRIAFRMYGPKLQSTGEISSGVDVWSKRVPQLVINDWYAREVESEKVHKEAVHKDVGQGLDCYKTGPTLGCGGTAIWENGQLIKSKNFTTWKVLANGPIRVVFELTYAPWTGAGVSVSEVKRISLDAGSHFNRLQSTFHFTGAETLPIAGGIVMHPGAVLNAPSGKGTIAIWEPADLHAGMMATGMVLPAGVDAPFQQADGHAFFVFPVKSDQPIYYYAGAGWSKSDVPDQATWNTMVEQFAGRVRNPVRIAWQ